MRALAVVLALVGTARADSLAGTARADPLAGTARADSLAVTWRVRGACVDGWQATADALVWAQGMNATHIERRDRATGKPLPSFTIPHLPERRWLLFATGDAIGVGDRTTAIVLDATTGAERWRVTTSKDREERTLGRDVLFNDELEGKLIFQRRDGATGKVLWQTERPKPKVGLLAAIHTTPTRVYLAFDDWSKRQTSGTIVALDAATGKTLWSRAYREPHARDIAFTLPGGETMALVITGREVVAFDPATGMPKRVPFTGGQFDANTGPARLYTTEHELVARDLPSGTVAWKVNLPVRARVVEATATDLFTLDDDHVLRRLDAKSGVTLARFGLGDKGLMNFYERGPRVVYCEDKALVALDVSRTPAEQATISGTVRCAQCSNAPAFRVRIADAIVPVDENGAFTAHIEAGGTIQAHVLGPDGEEWGVSTPVALNGARAYAVATIEAKEPLSPD